MPRHRSGYTLIELLLFVAISAIAAVAFVGILIVTVRLQVTQTSSAEVQTESTALLQQVQYYVQHAALVNIPMDTPTSTLLLRMGTGSIDPTVVSLTNGIVYVQQGSGSPQPLTSSRVVISNLQFTRHANPPAHDSVGITFTATTNTTDVRQLFSQAFETTVTQVSAATFDSNIVPSSSNIYSIGAAGSVWNNINNVIYFNGSNVGVGTASALAPFEVQGNDIFVYNPSGASYVTLRDPSGGCWRLAVNASGTLSTASVSCSTP